METQIIPIMVTSDDPKKALEEAMKTFATIAGQQGQVMALSHCITRAYDQVADRDMFHCSVVGVVMHISQLIPASPLPRTPFRS